MKKIKLLISCLVLGTSLSAQNATFESFLSQKDTFLNGSDVSPKEKIFTEGIYNFSCQFDSTYNYWLGGFAISSVTDSSTPSYPNVYGNITARGDSNSLVFTVGQNGAKMNLTGGSFLKQLAITNTTYAFKSMESGDFMAKKFTSKDKDSLVVMIYGYADTILRDSSLIYLADFTNDDSSKAFMLNNWKTIDFGLTFNGTNNYIFEMRSSDNSQGWMNTPGFFAIDNVVGAMNIIDNVKQKNSPEKILVYPNPVNDFVHIQHDDVIEKVTVFNNLGVKVLTINNTNTLDVSSLISGVYILSIGTSNNHFFQTIIKP